MLSSTGCCGSALKRAKAHSRRVDGRIWKQ